MQEPPIPPILAFVKTPVWKTADAESHEAFAELARYLGERVEEFRLPAAFKDAWKWHQTVMEADIAKNYEREYEQGKDKLSESLRAQIARGRRVRAVEYNKALDRIPALNAALNELFEQRYEAILTPATAGTAPPGLDSTGSRVTALDAAGCRRSPPLMQGADGCAGVRLVVRGGDARLLRNRQMAACAGAMIIRSRAKCGTNSGEGCGVAPRAGGAALRHTSLTPFAGHWPCNRQPWCLTCSQ